MKQIYTEKGFYRGFFSGSLPNLTRVVLKNLYRYPLMIKMPNIIEKKVPIARRDRKVAKALSGLAIAAIEAFILCPVERIKVFMMTRNSNQVSVMNRLSEHNLLAELYRGYLPLFTR